jgi:hypothetical protein
METVDVRDLSRELPKQDRQDRFIQKVLQGLVAEGHTVVQRTVFPSWKPILTPGGSQGLYLILSGNASIAFSKVATNINGFSKALGLIAKVPNPVAELNLKADSHPMVLCKGDLIGEFEYVQRRHPMGHVIAGTFFKAPETRKRLQTTVIRLPDDSKYAATASLHTMTEKLMLLNYLLLPSIHKRQSRINHILACFFAGLYPVYRAFYRQPDGTTAVEVPDPCDAMPADGEKYACLGKLDPTRDPIGIEVSTSYLMRCFGFPSTQAITADVDGYELDVYSDTSRLNKHNVEHLGSESLLFFIKRSPQEFCAEYGVDLQHSLLGEALAAVS